MKKKQRERETHRVRYNHREIEITEPDLDKCR